MRKFFAALLLALTFAFIQPAAAQFTKPHGNLPILAVPDYNVTISVWAIDTGVIGAYTGVFELHSDGHWYGCTNNPLADGNFEATVAAAGGAQAWLAGPGAAAINLAMSKCYPAIAAGNPDIPAASNSAVDQINYTLQSYSLKLVNGAPVLAPQ